MSPLPVMLLSLLTAAAHARSRSVWHNSRFHLLDSQLTRFLEEAYQGRVSKPKVTFLSSNDRRADRRRLEFEIERQGKIYLTVCDLVAKADTDELGTHACKATPNATVANYKRPLSAFTYLRP